MIGYLTVFLTLPIIYCFSTKAGKNKNKLFFIFATLLLTLFYGLRGSKVGGDTSTYIQMFLSDGNQSFSEMWSSVWRQKGPFYVVLEWLFYRITPSPQAWLIATSFFFFSSLSYLLYKNSNSPLFSLIIYFAIFGTFQMTGIRQSMAMAMLFFAYQKIKNNKFVSFIVILLVAFLFHKTSIVFLPFYFFARRKIRDYDIIILLFFLVPIYIFRVQIFNLVKSYTSYDSFDVLNHSEPLNFSIMIYSFTLMSFLAYSSFANKNNKSPSNNVSIKNLSALTNSMYLACIIMPLVAVNGSLRRVVIYFAIFSIISVPAFFERLFSKDEKKIFTFAFTIILIAIMFKGISESTYMYYLFIEE